MARPLTSRKHRTRAELAGHLTYAGCCGLSPGLSGAVRGCPGLPGARNSDGAAGVDSCEQKSPRAPVGGREGVGASVRCPVGTKKSGKPYRRELTGDRGDRAALTVRT